MTDHHQSPRDDREARERALAELPEGSMPEGSMPEGSMPEGSVPDVEPDPLYRALLAEVAVAAPPPVDWAALAARVDAAAVLPLARLRQAARAADARREPAWWEWAARRARAALPLAVAASLAMFAYARAHPVDLVAELADAPLTAAGDPLDAFSAAVAGGASASGVTTLLVTSGADAAAATMGAR